MKTWIQICVTAISMFLLPMGSPAYTILDNYRGADSYGGRDLLGDPAHFEVTKMEVSYSNGTMIVDIYSRYFDNIGSMGTRLGDLFISTEGWHPYGSSPYSEDDFTNGTNWDYVAVLDSHSATGGHFGLYKISDGGRAVFSSWEPNQIVRFVPSGDPVSEGIWSIDGLGTRSDFDDYLRFTINYRGWEIKDRFGLRWTMTCANDIIEGEAAIPFTEPSSLFLLTSGLLGLIGLRRKAKG